MKSLIIGLCSLSVATVGAAQDSLNAARELYGSAAYEEALATLNGLPDSEAGAEQVATYRAFCLIALGRTDEAQAVVDALIAKNALLELGADVSPRIESMFTATRRRLLPGLIRERYRAARASVDANELAEAERQLQTVQRLLDLADSSGAAEETTSDLRILVDGFLNLIRASAATPKPPTTPAPLATSPVPAPIAPLSAARAAPGAAGATAKAAQIYTTESIGVVAPVTIRQEAPAVPAAVRARTQVGGLVSGVLEILIDETGTVERVVVRESVDPAYDRLLAASARRWKYRPALVNDTPVKFLKTIAVVVSNDNSARIDGR